MALADQVKCTIAQHLGVNERELSAEALFRNDLRADSRPAFELLMALKDEFDIDIPDEDARKMRRLRDAIAYIESRASTK